MVKETLYSMFFLFFIYKYFMNRKIDNLYLPVHFVLAIFREYSKKVWEKGSVIIWILEAAVFAILFVISIKKNK